MQNKKTMFIEPNISIFGYWNFVVRMNRYIDSIINIKKGIKNF